SGEVVTANARTIRNLPLRLDTGGNAPPLPRLLSLRGEVLMYLEDFEGLNERLLADGEEPFANPRNASAGALRQLDPALTARRPLRVVCYDLLAAEPAAGLATQTAVREALAAWGLPVADRWLRATGLE